MSINIITYIKNGKSLQEQSKVFQSYFNEEIIQKIDFNDTCSERDMHNRPKIWKFENILIEAIYLTEDENYTLDKFIINESI